MEKISVLQTLQRRAYDVALRNDFRCADPSSSILERIAYLHSEASEVLEAARLGNQPSTKIPPFSHVEEELADVVLWCCIEAERRRYDLQAAVEAKLEYWAVHGKSKDKLF